MFLVDARSGIYMVVLLACRYWPDLIYWNFKFWVHGLFFCKLWHHAFNVCLWKLFWLSQGVQENLPRICLNHLDPTSVIISFFFSYQALDLKNRWKHSKYFLTTFSYVLTNSLYIFLLQCFFPQNLINRIQTPLFILNAAYDSWQVILQFCRVTSVQVFCSSWNFVMYKIVEDFVKQC